MKQWTDVFFDFDGVLVDSNEVKQRNIELAVDSVLGAAPNKAEFLDYFLQHSGLPREQKIEKFYPLQAPEVLAAYNALNHESLTSLPLLPGAVELIGQFKASGSAVYVLSGGDEGEVKMTLSNSCALDLFDGVYCGPQTKAQHLSWRQGLTQALFFGDSKYDYDVACQFSLNFVFLYERTKWWNWKSHLEGKGQVQVFLNLKEYCNLVSGG